MTVKTGPGVCKTHCNDGGYFSAAGGGGNPDVTPGADPARQDLAVSTTSTTVTFNAAAGGTGAFAYTTSLNKPAGSGATLSAGSGLGPWTLSSMANGESYVITLTATDSGDGQVANSCALVDVQATNQLYTISDARTVVRYNNVVSFPVYSVVTT
jgi:hypothetical protein